MRYGLPRRLAAFTAVILVTATSHARIDPVGVWSCVLYGPEKDGDERMLLELSLDGSTRLADLGVDRYLWTPVSRWSEKRGYLRFADPRRDREFVADLEYVALGGTWSGETYSGGWWCAPLEERPELAPQHGRFNEYEVMPRLVADVMATPWYPRRAVREATEGYAVVCFHVNPEGFVEDPHFIELSDPVFRESALGALSRSHYRRWSEALPRRPACRTFDYFLDGRRFF